VFTGIVEEAGEVARIEVRDDGARLVVRAPRVGAEARVGDSVAVNGVCLTVVEREAGSVAFDAVNETLRRSNLGTLREGDRVNLERSLRADGRFDGHVVQGHVDGRGVVRSITDDGNAKVVRIEAPAELLRYVVEKGSITVDGISLTVSGLGEDWFEVTIIPHTWEVTNLSGRKSGDPVNLEADVLAKYVERLLAARLGAGPTGG
jgi:riboflavin synthase